MGFKVYGYLLEKYTEGGTNKAVVPEEVTWIRMNAFYGCSSLEEVVLHEGITYIGGRAFSGCTSLKKICIPQSVKYIGINAFAGTPWFEEKMKSEDYFVINGILTGIRKTISEAVIPEGVKIIGDNAFGGCSLLTEVTLPDSLTEITESMFFYCKNLRSVYYKGVKINISDLKNPEEDLDNILNMILKLDFTAKYDNTVKYRYITDYYLSCENREAEEYIRKEFVKILTVFFRSGDNDRIKSLIDTNDFLNGKNINKVLESAFEKKCYTFIPLLLEYKDKLNKFTFDDLEKYFKYTEENGEITEYLLSYRNKYFTEEKLDEIRTENLKKEMGLTERTEADWKKLFTYKITDGNITINRYKGEETVVTVPDMIGKNPVTAIGDNAFSPEKKGTKSSDKERYTNIICVSLGKNIKEIGEYAFDGCTGLTEINIPDGVTRIGARAFFRCCKLGSISLPDGLISIEHRSFSECCSLTEIKLPHGITVIEENAFEENTELRKIYLNDGLTKIESYAFKNCVNLTEVSIPEGVMYLGYDTFCGCTSLKTINIPDSLTSIYTGAFRNTIWAEEQIKKEGLVIVHGIVVEGSKELTEIIIPEGVKTILGEAFSNGGLKNITFPESLVRIDNFAFHRCAGLTEIYLPAGAVNISSYAFKGCYRINKIMIGEEEADMGKFQIK